MKTRLLLLLWGACTLHVQAGSATWSLNPVSNDWNTAANWTPATEPNGPTDTATFGQSSKTSLTSAADVELASVVFNAGASAFQVTMNGRLGTTAGLTISGPGVRNESGLVQNFIAFADRAFPRKGFASRRFGRL